jgi:hypothetical protein
VTRTPTLLLVLALAGTPVATTLCIAWCDAEAATGDTAATCHKTSEGLPGVLAMAERGCDTRLQAEPFVREDVQRLASESVTSHAAAAIDQPVPSLAPLNAPITVWRTHVPVARALDTTVLRL